jgi:hypothetical protein
LLSEFVATERLRIRSKKTKIPDLTLTCIV